MTIPEPMSQQLRRDANLAYAGDEAAVRGLAEEAMRQDGTMPPETTEAQVRRLLDYVRRSIELEYRSIEMLRLMQALLAPLLREKEAGRG